MGMGGLFPLIQHSLYHIRTVCQMNTGKWLDYMRIVPLMEFSGRSEL